MRSAGHDDALVLGCGRERVHEVEMRAVGDAVEERVRPGQFDGVPANVRQRGGAFQAHGLPRQKRQRLGVAFSAALEEELVAEADSQARPIRANPVAQRVDQPSLAQVGHGRSGRSNARNHDGIHAVERRGVRGHDHASARGHERLPDAHHVRRAVVEYRYEQRPPSGHQRGDPFVEATPVRRGSTAQAARSDRPRALNAASAR